MLAKVLSAVAVIVLVRGLPPESYAFLTLFLTLAQLGGSAIAGGIRTRYLRDSAERVSRGQPLGNDEFVSALGRSIALLLVLGIVVALVTTMFGIGRTYGGAGFLALCATGYALGWATIELAMAHWQAKRRFAVAGVLNPARSLAMVAAAVVVVGLHSGVRTLAYWFIAFTGAVSNCIVRDVQTRGGSSPSAVSPAPHTRGMVALGVLRWSGGVCLRRHSRRWGPLGEAGCGSAWSCAPVPRNCDGHRAHDRDDPSASHRTS